MRTLAVLAVWLMLIATAFAAGKQKQKQQAKHKDALLERYDVNHDGSLDEDEVKAVEKDFADRFDKNGDKKLDKGELNAVRQELSEQAAKGLRKKK